MATKQEKAIKSAVTREKKKGILREEKHVLWFLIAIIILLLYLLFAQNRGWWPYASPKLGSAFYTNLSANTPAQQTSDDGSNGANGDNDNDDGNNSSNPTPNPGGNNGDSTNPDSSNSIADLAASVNVGDNKAQVTSKATSLGSGCAVVVNVVSQPAGKQEVCTYTQGDKIITVTYLNDQVISASKSGF